MSSAGGSDNIESLFTARSFPLAATVTDPDGETETDSITVKDASTSATYLSDTFVLTYQSPPASKHYVVKRS